MQKTTPNGMVSGSQAGRLDTQNPTKNGNLNQVVKSHDRQVDSDFLAQMTDKIVNSEFFGPKARNGDTYISGLICPECGKAEAFAYSKAPFVLICNRSNKCGAHIKTLDLFPELKVNIERDYKPTKTNPNLPATASLNSRGLYKSLDGLLYRYARNIRQTGSGGVMFHVADGVSNGRIFNPPQGEGKTHNVGKCGGMYWRHQGIKYDHDLETFVTEGVIDALSFIEMGFQAIAVLSSGQDPSKVNLSEFTSLTFAFDADEAGRKALKKWMKYYPSAQAVEVRYG